MHRRVETADAVGTCADESGIAPEGIVNLDGRGMLVVPVARRLGSEGPLLAYCAAHSNRAGPQKAPGVREHVMLALGTIAGVAHAIEIAPTMSM